jgi:hypothetical protein
VAQGDHVVHGPRSTDANKAIVRRFPDEVFNAGKVDRADELFTEDHVDHGACAQPGHASGLEGARWTWTLYIAAIADLCVPIEDMVAEGTGSRHAGLLRAPTAASC